MKAFLYTCALVLASFGRAQTLSVTAPPNSVAPGDTFTVNVTASGMTDLYAAQFDLSFDPAILSATAVQPGSFLAPVFIPGRIDNTAGSLNATAGTMLGSVSGVAGSGVLARIHFTALTPGTSRIALQNVIALDSTLSDIAVTEDSGSVTVSSAVITPGGVVPLDGSTSSIQPGSLVSIFGANLAAGDATWKGDFPTQLGGVQVAIDGKPAYLWYVSSQQINLQAPDDDARGPVDVTVTTASGTARSTVTLASAAPSFVLFNSKYPAAVIPTPNGNGAYGAGSYDLLGPSGAFSFASRPIHVGETVELYATGFGPTGPFVPAGQLVSSAAPALDKISITIGGVPAEVPFAGIVGAGLFQLNVTIPQVAPGDQLLQATVAGTQAQAGIFVTVQ